MSEMQGPILEILELKRDYAVIYKPQGIPSQPTQSGGTDVDVTSILRGQIGGEIYPVHRLDLDTEGVMVYARTKIGAAHLSGAITRGEFEKEYLAIVHGITEEGGEMRDLLFHRQSGNKSFVVDRMRAGVKEAILTYRRMDAAQDPEPLSLVRIKLETGRTHQIRVQFAHRGHPLYGDGKYGAHSPGKTALCCTRITFPSPETKRPLTFTFTTAPKSPIWQRLFPHLPSEIAATSDPSKKSKNK